MKDVRFITGVFLSTDPTDMMRSRATLLELLEALVRVNQRWIQTYPKTPKLYATNVVYRTEKTEHWRDIPTVLKAGFGDCEDLAAWRIAELREQGLPAWPYIKWRVVNGRSIYHALVHRWDNKIEDPSRALGMRHAIVRKPVFIGKVRKTGGYDMQGLPTIVGRNGTEVILAACAGLDSSYVMGAWYSKAVKQTKKGFRKVPWKKVHAVARIAGPIVAVCYPPAAPAVAGALALTYAASKNDPKAILAKENIDRMAKAGVPAAQEAQEVMAVVGAIKKQQSAVKVIGAIKGGDLALKAKVEGLKQLEGVSSEAANATNALRFALKGQTPAFQEKLHMALAKSAAEYPANPDIEFARWQARRAAYKAGM